ncbi:MAG: hypothetical protein Q9165_000208 [Trypethelium subeluteriae]
MDRVTKQLDCEAEGPEKLEINVASTTSFDKYPAKQHARRVAQKLGVSRGLIYLPGAEIVPLEDSDQAQPFRQRRYFYYLSGVDESDCHLTYDIELDELILYVAEYSLRNIIYNGRGLNVVEALERYDIDNAHYASDLSKDVKKWIRKHPIGKIYILHPSQTIHLGGSEDDEDDQFDDKKLQRAIDLARMIKDPHEIDMIKKANDISAKAHRQILREISSLSNEREVEAIFRRECMFEGAKHQAYKVIAASGKNAATLHYVQNDEPLKGRQLMCLDAGCEWNCYASDVTRTFPLSPQWPSREAENIYNLVLKMQESCISKLKPGTRFLELNTHAHVLAIEGLLELGILHNGSPVEIMMAGTSTAFLPHGLGHHIGLEVHDVSVNPTSEFCDDVESALDAVAPETYFHLVQGALQTGGAAQSALLSPNAPELEEGMKTMANEHRYFSRFALEELFLKHPVHSKFINKEALTRYYPVGGVRIEDDILITKKGYENLTTAPKGPAMFDFLLDRGPRPLPMDWLDCGPPVPPRRRPKGRLKESAKKSLKESQGVDPLPEITKKQQSLWEAFGNEVKPEEKVVKMNREKAQMTIEEALKRLEKLQMELKEKKRASSS